MSNTTSKTKKTFDYKDNSLYLPPIYEVQKDVEGYITSFSVEQPTEYTEFFNKFGFVVIRDVLSKSECQKTIDDIWDYIESFKWASYHDSMKSEEKTIKRNDPKSWDGIWPNLSQEGIVGYPPVFSETTIANRSNPKIYSIYSTLLNRKDLYINHDRFGFFRPTKDCKLPFPNITPDHQFNNGTDESAISESTTTTTTTITTTTSATTTTTSTPDTTTASETGTSTTETKKTTIIKSNFNKWKTVENLHLDLNPFTFIEDEEDNSRKKVFSTLTYKNGEDFFIENNQPEYIDLNVTNIQGLINLCDNKKEDGGFIVVPGFHSHIKEWTLNNAQIKEQYGYHSNFVCIEPGNPLYGRAIRVTARHGSLILFNQKLLHGSSPNNNHRPRMAMFLKMFGSNQIPKETLERRQQSIKQSFEKNKIKIDHLNELQRKTLGLELW
ncbi:hypothetical protein ACTFIV_007249 [Dictyostelium citrinum]